MRGYSYYSFESGECSAADCPEIGRLRGTRVALASAEVRIPLFGTPSLGLISFRYLPTDLSLFVDAGLAWTEEEPPVLEWSRRSPERIPVVSAGVSTRMNLFNALVLEIYYAYPFQRPEKGGHMGLLILPGW